MGPQQLNLDNVTAELTAAAKLSGLDSGKPCTGIAPIACEDTEKTLRRIDAALNVAQLTYAAAHEEEGTQTPQPAGAQPTNKQKGTTQNAHSTHNAHRTKLEDALPSTESAQPQAQQWARAAQLAAAAMISTCA
ncbi:hypothetical protein ERJ75_001314100 [Trypanosoma vivax]|nr:hypothetical protein ERJ75_001314100 [Trypanosoma vivax]